MCVLRVWSARGLRRQRGREKVKDHKRLDEVDRKDCEVRWPNCRTTLVAPPSRKTTRATSSRPENSS